MMALSIWGGFRRPMHTSLVGIIGMGSAIPVTGLAPRSALWLAAGSMFVTGFMTPICAVEPTMQGRVLTLLDSMSTAMSPLSLAIVGPVFDRLGPQIWYVGSGALALLIGIAGSTTPRILNSGPPQSSEDGCATARTPSAVQSRVGQHGMPQQ
jgi:MFS transporter, DHA3 family, macrolide efflux protein